MARGIVGSVQSMAETLTAPETQPRPETPPRPTDTQTHTRAPALERRITVVAVVLPFLGFIAAIVLLWGGAVTWLDLGILAVMYVAIGLGVTIGFHPMLPHRELHAKPAPARRRRLARHRQRPVAFAHGLAVRGPAHLRAPLRSRPAQGPADPLGRQVLPAVGAARPRAAGAARLRGPP